MYGLQVVRRNLQDHSDKIVLPTQPEPTVLKGVEVDDAWAMSLIGAYMVTDSVAIELLAATPFKHDIDVAGTDLAAGSAKQLPPTLSMQWYPRELQHGATRHLYR